LEEVRTVYRQWLETQDEQFDVRALAQRTGLIGEKTLWSRRAPENTCLGALREMRNGFADNHSKGCGAVTRSAPFGFLVLAGQDLDQIFELACGGARLTHGHRTGFLAAGAFALIIAQLTMGLPLGEAISNSADLVSRHEGAQETTKSLRRALQIGRGPDWRAMISTLGEGWVAEEALAIGVAAAVGASSLREAVIVAVNHDGDSDSTGSIAGNIRGVIEGPDAIPAEWLVPLEFRKGIVELGTQFAAELLATQSA
jgi:ADP-ribosylglycohydrolase